MNIALFDVTPVKDPDPTHLGMVENYYTTTHMLWFLDETVAICRAISHEIARPIHLLLKPKRPYTPAHDPRYIQVVQLLERAGLLTVLHTQTNIYSLLAECHGAIVVPYSSPALVAVFGGVPAVYFDATQDVLPSYEQMDGLEFASGCEELSMVLHRWAA